MSVRPHTHRLEVIMEKARQWIEISHRTGNLLFSSPFNWKDKKKVLR